MQFPPEIQAAMEKIIAEKNENTKKFEEIIKKQAPDMLPHLVTNIADRLASFALMSELLRQAHRKPEEERYIANMYTSFATGIAEAYNPRTWEGDIILNNLFKLNDNQDDIT